MKAEDYLPCSDDFIPIEEQPKVLLVKKERTFLIKCHFTDNERQRIGRDFITAVDHDEAEIKFKEKYPGYNPYAILPKISLGVDDYHYYEFMVEDKVTLTMPFALLEASLELLKSYLSSDKLQGEKRNVISELTRYLGNYQVTYSRIQNEFLGQ